MSKKGLQVRKNKRDDMFFYSNIDIWTNKQTDTGIGHHDWYSTNKLQNFAVCRRKNKFIVRNNPWPQIGYFNGNHSRAGIIWESSGTSGSSCSWFSFMLSRHKVFSIHGQSSTLFHFGYLAMCTKFKVQRVSAF